MNCSICNVGARRRAAIDRHLLQGRSIRSTARKFNVGEDALGRHRHHMRAAITRAAAVTAPDSDVAYGHELLREAAAIRADAIRLQHEAEAERDIKTALRGLQMRLSTLESVARLTGAIEPPVSKHLSLDVQVDEATAARIVNAYLLTRPGTPALPLSSTEENAKTQILPGQNADFTEAASLPAEAPDLEGTCIPINPTTKVN